MKLPLFIIEGQDVSIYKSVKNAECALEAIDIHDGVYHGYDSDGVELIFSTTQSTRDTLFSKRLNVELVTIEASSKKDIDKLYNTLNNFLTEIGHSPVKDSDLKDLIIMMLMR